MHNGWKLSRIAAMFVIVFGIGGAAWAQDQCSMPTVGVGTGSVGNATGPNTCGVVITVTAVDGLGNATAMTAANTGNGNPYDGSEDTLVGIQNSSGNNLSAITLSSSVTGAEALFSFDGDGPCNLAFHTPYSWCMTAGFTGYEGPDNTFTNISTDKTRGTVKFTSAIPNAGSTWFALEGTPQSLVTVTPIQTAPPVLLTSGQTNDADFLFSATNGQIVDHKLHFPSDTPFPNGETTVNVLSSNVVLSNRDWPPFVIGTPFAPSQLFVKSGDNQAANGTDFGSIYEDTCYVSDPSTASEQQCPGFLAGDTTPGDLIGAIDLFDLASPKPTITPGANCATDACTAAMIHFFPTQTPAETWSPSSTSPNPACTSPLNGSPSSPPVDCDLNNVLNFQITGDGSTTSGGTLKKGSYASVFNVPMLETAVKVNGTAVNTPGRQSTTATTVPFQSTGSIEFTVYPAGCLNQPLNTVCPSIAAAANNRLSPAPAALLNYSVTSGANTVVASTTQTFPTNVVQPEDVTNSTALNPGTYVIHWKSLDSVANVEQNVSQVPPTNGTCPDGSNAPSGSQCYVTSGFTTMVTVSENLVLNPNTKISITATAFQISGGFTISNSTPGINPITQGLTLTLGNYTVTIPPNKFTMSKGSFVFQGNVLNPANSHLVNLQIQISPTTGTTFTLKVQAGSGANPGTSHPLTLTIGPYSGTIP